MSDIDIDVNDLPSISKRNKRVNDIDTLISKTNTHVVEALDKIVEVMNNESAKPSDVLNASKAYIQFFILFRDKKQEWEDRKLKRELLQLNIKHRKNPTNQKDDGKDVIGFDINYAGENDEYLRS